MQASESGIIRQPTIRPLLRSADETRTDWVR